MGGSTYLFKSWQPVREGPRKVWTSEGLYLCDFLRLEVERARPRLGNAITEAARICLRGHPPGGSGGSSALQAFAGVSRLTVAASAGLFFPNAGGRAPRETSRGPPSHGDLGDFSRRLGRPHCQCRKLSFRCPVVRSLRRNQVPEASVFPGITRSPATECSGLRKKSEHQLS